MDGLGRDGAGRPAHPDIRFVIPDPFVGSFDKMGLFYKSGWRSIGYFLVLTVFSVTVPPALMYASLRSPSRRRSELGTTAALSISAAVLVFVSMYGAGLIAKNVLYFGVPGTV